MTAGHLRKPTREPATLACRLRAGISQASWRGGSLGRSTAGPAGSVRAGAGVCRGGPSGGPGGRGRGARGPCGSQRGDGGAGAGCAAARGPAGEEGDRGPHRGPRAVGRASRPSAGSAGPSRGCRRSGPPGRSRHISPPHPGSPPWLAPSSVSCGSAATRGGSRRRRGGEAGRGWGRAEASGEERRRPRRRGPGALAGLRLRLLSAASPPPVGRYGSSRIPPGPRTDLPGPTARADSAVPAWRGPARGRPTWGPGVRAIPGRLTAGGFRRGGDPAACSGSDVPPDLPGRPARAAARLPIAARRRVGVGTSVFRKIPRDRRPRLWAPSLGRILSGEDRASGTGVQEAQESLV